jgi:hypothetical protein
MAKQTFTTGQVLTAAQMTSLQQTAMLGGAASAKTASYTLVAADAGTAISMSNAGATTITVNTALFAAGDTVHITNLGAGVCTITAGTATVNSSASLALAQYESGFLDFTSTSAAIFVKGAGASAPAGDKSLLVPTISGKYLKLVTNSALGERYMDEDVTEYVPIYLPGYALDRISIRTGGGLLNGQTVRLGIYNTSATTGLPTTVYLDAGTVAPNAANTNYEITISTTPPAGYYYLAFNGQTLQPNPYFATMSSPIWSSWSAPSDTVQDVSYIKGFTQTGVTGAFATAGTLSPLTQNPPLIAVRMA